MIKDEDIHEIDKTHSIELETHELLAIVLAIGFWGEHSKSHPDLAEPSHKAMELLNSIGSKIRSNHPAFFAELVKRGFIMEPRVAADVRRL